VYPNVTSTVDRATATTASWPRHCQRRQLQDCATATTASASPPRANHTDAPMPNHPTKGVSSPCASSPNKQLKEPRHNQVSHCDRRSTCIFPHCIFPTFYLHSHSGAPFCTSSLRNSLALTSRTVSAPTFSLCAPYAWSLIRLPLRVVLTHFFRSSLSIGGELRK
jgi:hypothetical protein